MACPRRLGDSNMKGSEGDKIMVLDEKGFEDGSGEGFKDLVYSIFVILLVIFYAVFVRPFAKFRDDFCDWVKKRF